jgi:hypothetical protein
VRVTLLLKARIVLITKVTVIQRAARARLPLTRILPKQSVTTPAMRFTVLEFLLTPVLHVIGPMLTLLLAASTPMLIRLKHRHFDTVTRLKAQALPRSTNC